MADAAAEFTYSNLNPRPAGPLLRTASRLLPGIGRVQAQAVPYAEAWRAANLRALAGTGPLWVALGDSLSQGVGASAYDRGWIGLLHAELRAPEGVPYRLVNLSMTGARVDDVRDRQLPALESLPTPAAFITLLIGSNDLFRRADRDTVARRYEELLRGLPTAPATVLVGTLPNGSPTAHALNLVTQKIARERGFTVADTRRDPRTQFWAGKLAADRFHPNDRGYRAIADVFGDALARATPS